VRVVTPLTVDSNRRGLSSLGGAALAEEQGVSEMLLSCDDVTDEPNNTTLVLLATAMIRLPHCRVTELNMIAVKSTLCFPLFLSPFIHVFHHPIYVFSRYICTYIYCDQFHVKNKLIKYFKSADKPVFDAVFMILSGPKPEMNFDLIT